MAKNEDEKMTTPEKQHEMYCDYNQTEREDDNFMAFHNHPFAEDYKKLRAYFDSLSYACNSNARFIACGETEWSEYWSPSLYVTWNPGGAYGHYNVYPAMGETWDKYLRDAAENGWKDTDPKLNCGQFIIKTKYERLVGLLRKIEGFSDSQPDYYTVCPTSVKDCFKIIEAVERYQKKWLLPKGNFVCSEVPLAKKNFRFGNIERVTEKPRSIIVPLVPIGDDGSIVAPIANDLISLVRRGYPYQEARSWLSKFLEKSCVSRLDKEFV